MKTKERISLINIKLYLNIAGLKESKKLTLEKTTEDERLVFIFKNKESLYNFLIDKDIDASNSTIKDIIDNKLILKSFTDGTVICPKIMCQYLYNKCQASKGSTKAKEYQKKIKAKIDNIRAKVRTKTPTIKN